MARTGRDFTAEQKAGRVRRHLSGKEAVTDWVEQLGIQPSQIHLGVKQSLDQAEKAFHRTAGNRRAECVKGLSFQQVRVLSRQRSRAAG